MTVIDTKTKDIVFSDSCKKQGCRMQSVAECLAKHWKTCSRSQTSAALSTSALKRRSVERLVPVRLRRLASIEQLQENIGSVISHVRILFGMILALAVGNILPVLIFHSSTPCQYVFVYSVHLTWASFLSLLYSFIHFWLCVSFLSSTPLIVDFPLYFFSCAYTPCSSIS